MPVYKLGELAELLGVQLDGNPDIEIKRINGIAEASPGDITFVHNPKYQSAITTTQASALILDMQMDNEGRPTLRSDNPYLTFAKASGLFAPDRHLPKTISELACISDKAELGENVAVGPFVVIEQGSRIGTNSIICAGTFVGAGTVIGDDCLLYPNVTIREYCTLGNRVIIQPGAVIGGDGFGFAPTPDGIFKVPQIGSVTIGDDVEIQANTCIDRGTINDTEICDNVKIDNLVQLAHNVKVNENTMIAAQCGISGSTTIGKRCILAGQVGLVGHITIDDDVTFGAQAGVIKSAKGPEVYWGTPSRPLAKIKRNEAYINQLEKMSKRLKELEKKVAELSEGDKG